MTDCQADTSTLKASGFNGEGFVDLTHAWMMFAPSAKKHDPTKAGHWSWPDKKEQAQ
ncbi:MAG: hypothetical protein ABGZ53_35055 [Fuerstiella sp.]